MPLPFPTLVFLVVGLGIDFRRALLVIVLWVAFEVRGLAGGRLVATKLLQRLFSNIEQLPRVLPLLRVLPPPRVLLPPRVLRACAILLFGS